MLIAMSWTNSWTRSWIGWALLSAVFAAATALLAKVGVAHVDSNLATAVRTSVVVVFAWGIVLALGSHGEIRTLDRRTVLFLDAVGIGDGIVVAVLLPRAAAWAGFARGAAGQAERAAGDGVRVAAAGREAECRGGDRRIADYGRSDGDGVWMTGEPWTVNGER